MTSAIHLVGAVRDRMPGLRYFERLPFVEIAPRPPLPRPSVLAAWRRDAPDGIRTTLLAPPITWKTSDGAFRDDPKRAEGAAWLLRSARGLDAEAVVLATGADLTTGPRDRERFARWVEHLTSRGRRVVWVPGGLWDASEAARLARHVGALCGFDPLEGEPPAGELAYGRLRAIGVRARLGEGLLGALVDALTSSRAATTFLAIDGDDAPAQARRVADRLAAALDDTPPFRHRQLPLRRDVEASEPE